MIIDNRLLLLKLSVLSDVIPRPVFCWFNLSLPASLVRIALNVVAIICFILILRFYLYDCTHLPFLLFCRLLTVAELLYIWQKQSVSGHCESWSKTSKHCGPSNLFLEGFLWNLEVDEYLHFFQLFCLLFESCLDAATVFEKELCTFIQRTETPDSNVAAKSSDCWHTGSAWQQLIYNRRTYLAKTGAKE